MQQRWSEIQFGNGKYSVSDAGEVRYNLTGKAVPTQIQNAGYRVVCLTHKGKRKTATIHRLVAIAFIEAIPGKTRVDHKDTNKLNNTHLNLRWVTGKENMEYAAASGCLENAAKKAKLRMKTIGSKYGFSNSQKHLKKAIPVELKLNGRPIQFKSIRHASSHLNIDHKTLTRRLKCGQYK